MQSSLNCWLNSRTQADTENHDWLQFRNEEWEPEAVDNWLVIGQRHACMLPAPSSQAACHLLFSR